MLHFAKNIALSSCCIILGLVGLWLCITTPVDEESFVKQIETIPDHDYLPEIRELEAKGRLGEAEHLVDWVLSGSSITNRDEVAALRAEINRKRTSLWNRSKRAVKGFVVGEGTSIEELGGAVVSDFLLWGDIRDLAKQGYNKITGKETDPVVAALAAVGVGTSVAIFVAGGATAAEAVATPVTGGASSAAVPATATATSAAAVADASVSFLKILRKTGHLTKRFSRFLVDACRRTSKAKSLDKGLGEAFVGIKNLTQGVGAARAATIMKHVDDLDSLKAVSAMAKRMPEPTAILVRMHGKNGVKVLGELTDATDGAVVLEKATRKGPKVLGKLLSYTKNGVRTGKAFWLGHPQKLCAVCVKVFGRVKCAMVAFLMVAFGFWQTKVWRVTGILRRLVKRVCQIFVRGSYIRV